MKQTTTAVIFDLDGVIVHTDVFHYKAWKQVADRLGLPFDEEINNRLRGVSRMESLDIILNNAGVILTESEKEALAYEKNELYKGYLQTMSPDDVQPEVIGTLKQLRADGYKLAIGSSSRNAKIILERVGLEHFFDEISDGNNISRSKPDPEVFLKAAEYLKENPAYCIVVEDAAAGIQAGQSAGMKTIAIGDAAKCGYSDFIAGTFSDILSIVKKMS